MQRSARQILGDKFEIWLELLLQELDHKPIYRNVEFHKERHIYRQADLIFYSSINGKIKMNLVEAKFSSQSEIKYELREPVKKYYQYSTIKINNLVDEIYERKNFVRADKAYLVTNTTFEPKLIEEAQKAHIELISGKELCQMKYKTYTKDNYEQLQKSISEIRLKNHKTAKSIIYQ